MGNVYQSTSLANTARRSFENQPELLMPWMVKNGGAMPKTDAEWVSAWKIALAPTSYGGFGKQASLDGTIDTLNQLTLAVRGFTKISRARAMRKKAGEVLTWDKPVSQGTSASVKAPTIQSSAARPSMQEKLTAATPPLQEKLTAATPVPSAALPPVARPTAQAGNLQIGDPGWAAAQQIFLQNLLKRKYGAN